MGMIVKIIFFLLKFLDENIQKNAYVRILGCVISKLSSDKGNGSKYFILFFYFF